MENASDVALATEPHGNGIRVTRNMNSRISVDDQHTSGPRPCTCVHCTFGRDTLVTKTSLAGDLADHTFGHLVSAVLARDILAAFVIDGFVQVFQGEIPHDEQASEAPLDPHSEDVQLALVQAFEVAAVHDCIRLYPEGSTPVKHSPSVDEKKEKTYSFRWRTFPKDPFAEDELVSFLNEITDRAFAAVKPRLATTGMRLRHRLVALEDKHHAVALAYEPDGAVARPRFLLLPIEAFSGEGFKTVNKKYINLTVARLVGESNEHLATGLDEIQWYAESLKASQPWLYYVLGMTISQDVAVFSRVDPSDWEHLVLLLWDGRGCIEFIRILLGLALADGIDLGQNPAIELMFEGRTFQADNRTRHSEQSDEVSSTADPDLDSAGSDDATSEASIPSCHSKSTIPREDSVEKRHYSEIEDDDDSEEGSRSKKHKTTEIN